MVTPTHRISSASENRMRAAPGPAALVGMPELRLPAVDVHSSFVEAMAEFSAEGRGGADDNTMVGGEIRDGGWQTAPGFADFVAMLHADAVAPRRAGWVACTTWWWCEGSTYLGRIALRHELTERLRKIGGHVGYDVRPTARRQGHATAMLAAVLPHARRMDIEALLVTCDADNVASRRVIEANGGTLADESDGNLRYWINR
jgi:predicted acetyltransferase